MLNARQETTAEAIAVMTVDPAAMTVEATDAIISDATIGVVTDAMTADPAVMTVEAIAATITSDHAAIMTN
jgi:hypothetical protein